jgi:transaldolase
MKATQTLHDLGQSIWLDNITRDLLNQGTLKRYIEELSVTGLTSNPTIFDHAMWASTGTKNPKAADTLYITALAAPFTVNTMPEATLKALADHGELRSVMAADGGNSEAVINAFARAGISVDALATQLQDEGASSFVKSWNELMTVINSKSHALRQAA